MLEKVLKLEPLNPDAKRYWAYIQRQLDKGLEDESVSEIQDLSQELSVQQTLAEVDTEEIFQTKGKKRRSGTGYVKQLSKNCWQGRYTPTIGGKRISENVYGATEAECEAKLAELITRMKAEYGIA